ncbi:SURF1 family protein [Ferrimonas lipolytica]|uniref:SURF1-like protein n=1 Tax=Ferrimonas lipolytica TaxID=2724191 RepID=A0A6H1UH29_9GAMM|nr:SURF1 family protein [Ferrimonas lipolytica]QIZ78391.1 SURF1 family protein [Ferrimonas lipolytica]
MKNVLWVMVTVAVLALLVKLGWWQLQRASEKQQLQLQYQQRANETIQWPLPPQQDWRGYRLETAGKWLSERSLLLDNQVFQGRVGYRWLVPLQMSPTEPWLLVDLGFVVAPTQRDELPTLPPLPNASVVVGRLLQPQPNRMSDQLWPEVGVATRVQALNWQQLEAHFQHSVVAGLLWLEQPQQLGFVRPWQPINMAPEKHQAYAAQWFGLALAWLITVALLWRKTANGKEGMANASLIGE